MLIIAYHWFYYTQFYFYSGVKICPGGSGSKINGQVGSGYGSEIIAKVRSGIEYVNEN